MNAGELLAMPMDNHGIADGDTLIRKEGNKGEKETWLDKEDNPEAPAELTSAEQPMLLVNLEPFQVEAGTLRVPQCLRCRRPFAVELSALDGYAEAKRLRLGVCDCCYRQLVLLGTADGRRSVEDLLRSIVPPLYRSAELRDFRAYNLHLVSVYNAVAEWCRSALESGRPSSFFLYSENDGTRSGCGNGKSMLLWTAFKHIVRWGSELKPLFARGMLSGIDSQAVQPLAFACDLQADLCTPYLNAKKDGGAMDLHKFESLYLGHPNPPDVSTVDAVVLRLIGKVPVLFLDDVGHDHPDSMATGLYQKLLDLRATQNRPTFITSNFSPEHLAKRIGDRAASRLWRTDCKVVEVQAPDFSAVKDRLEPA